ncbi:hypothetical protein [Streptomyces thioluteus]
MKNARTARSRGGVARRADVPSSAAVSFADGTTAARRPGEFGVAA